LHAPGWINVTEQQEFTQEDCAAIPAGKVGTPKDISNMVLFLCQQDFITGETIIVDGGMSKRMIIMVIGTGFIRLISNARQPKDVWLM